MASKYQALNGKVREFITSFEQDSVEVVEGYRFNQRDTLKRIELYFNSKFESGDKDSDGLKKFFYNIVHLPCDTATKAIDIDTKDFRLIPEAAESQMPTLFLQKELEDWMKENAWAEKLNEIVSDLPKYGSVVVKKMKDTVEIVNIHNLTCDPAVDELKDSEMVIETHVMTPFELRQMPWDPDGIERVIDMYAKRNKKQIIVREVRGWFRPSDIGEEGNDLTPYFYVCAGTELKKRVRGKDLSLTETLYIAETDEEEFPYFEVHWDKVPGRWLGMGLVEKNFDPQVRMNEIANLKAKALYWTSKVLFSTGDPTQMNNLLTDVKNGDIIKNAAIEQIPMGLQDMGVFQQEEARWDKNIQESSFAFDTEVGQTLPSGTPFRLGALLKQSSQGFFQFKREKLGIFLQELFFDTIIPSFRKAKHKKHTLTIPKSDKDVKAVIERQVDFMVSTSVQQYAEETGFYPNIPELQAERQRIKSELEARPSLFMEIPDGYYQNAKFNMKLVITDEQVDMVQKLETISNLIQLVGSNPGILQDEATRTMVFAAMNLAGVSPIEIGLDRAAENPSAALMAQQQAMAQPGQLPGPQIEGVPQPQ